MRARTRTPEQEGVDGAHRSGLSPRLLAGIVIVLLSPPKMLSARCDRRNIHTRTLGDVYVFVQEARRSR